MIDLSPREESEKTAKGEGIFDKIKKGGKEFVEGVKEEVTTSKTVIQEKSQDFKSQQTVRVRSAVKKRINQTTTPEELYFSTWAWFWVLFFAIIGCFSLFFMGMANPRFFPAGLLALIAFPFIAGWCLVHMIPTVRIFGFTVFDRRKLSLRRQLSVGKEIARVFSREFIGEEPLFAFFVLTFVFIFILAIAVALISG